MPEIFSILGMLFTVAAVLVLAYFVTRYLGGHGLRLPGGASRGGNMRLVDQLPLSREQKLALVQVGERWLLLGVSPNATNLLAELTAEEAALWQEEAQTGGEGAAKPLPSFRDAFLEAVKNKGKKQ